jgi:hypothetical protein
MYIYVCRAQCNAEIVIVVMIRVIQVPAYFEVLLTDC